MSAEIADALRVFLSTPRTIDELSVFLGVSRRTVFRYLKQMPRIQRVGMSRPTKYEVR